MQRLIKRQAGRTTRRFQTIGLESKRSHGRPMPAGDDAKARASNATIQTTGRNARAEMMRRQAQGSPRSCAPACIAKGCQAYHPQPQTGTHLMMGSQSDPWAATPRQHKGGTTRQTYTCRMKLDCSRSGIGSQTPAVVTTSGCTCSDTRPLSIGECGLWRQNSKSRKQKNSIFWKCPRKERGASK